MRYKILFMVAMTITGCSYSVLDILDTRERNMIYNSCLIEHNYESLGERFIRVNHKASKQRLASRAASIREKCNKRAEEHVSI